MNLNQEGIDLIKSFESCRLVVYKDIVGLSTVGYGHRTDMAVGTAITQDEASTLLQNDLDKTCNALKSCIKTGLNDNQFSACVSLAFNIGTHAFETSTLLKLINSGDLAGAAKQFQRWDLAVGRVVDGLLRRRLAEMDLFLKLSTTAAANA